MRHLTLTEADRLAYDHTARMRQDWGSDQRWAKGWPPTMAGVSDLVISCSLPSTWGLLRDRTIWSMAVDFLVSLVCPDPIRRKLHLLLPLSDCLCSSHISENYSFGVKFPKPHPSSQFSLWRRFHALGQYYINCHSHRFLHYGKGVMYTLHQTCKIFE